MVPTVSAAHKRSADHPAVDKTMRVADILALCPEATPLLAEYGLHCVGCAANGLEPLEDGCRLHGFDDETIDALVDDVNDLIAAQPEKPQTLTVTAAASQAIRTVAEEEKRIGQGLAVIVDGQGGFCMEFRQDPTAEEHVFTHAEHPDVRVFADGLTLGRIGGSTIDFREGRFKLDLPGTAKACACGGNCTCKK